MSELTVDTTENNTEYQNFLTSNNISANQDTLINSNFSNFLNSLNAKAQNIQSDYKTKTVNSSIKSNTSSINKKALDYKPVNEMQNNQKATESKAKKFNDQIQNTPDDSPNKINKTNVQKSTKNTKTEYKSDTSKTQNDYENPQSEEIKNTNFNQKEDNVPVKKADNDKSSDETNSEKNLNNNSSVDPSPVIFLDENNTNTQSNETKETNETIVSLISVINSELNNQKSKTEQAENNSLDELVDKIDSKDSLINILEKISEFIFGDSSKELLQDSKKEDIINAVNDILSKLSSTDTTSFETTLENVLNTIVENNDENIRTENKAIEEIKEFANLDTQEFEAIKNEAKEVIKETISLINDNSKENNSDTVSIKENTETAIDSTQNETVLTDNLTKTEANKDLTSNKEINEVKIETALNENKTVSDKNNENKNINNENITIDETNVDTKTNNTNDIADDTQVKSTEEVKVNEPTENDTNLLKTSQTLVETIKKTDTSNLKEEDKKVLQKIVDLMSENKDLSALSANPDIKQELENIIKQLNTADLDNETKENITNLVNEVFNAVSKTNTETKTDTKEKVNTIENKALDNSLNNDTTILDTNKEIEKSTGAVAQTNDTSNNTKKDNLEPKTNYNPDSEQIEIQDTLKNTKEVSAKDNQTKEAKIDNLNPDTKKELKTDNKTAVDFDENEYSIQNEEYNSTDEIEISVDKIVNKPNNTTTKDNTQINENFQKAILDNNDFEEFVENLDVDFSFSTADESGALSVSDEITKIALNESGTITSDFKGTIVYDSIGSNKVIKIADFAKTTGLKNPVSELENSNFLNQIGSKIEQLKNAQGQKLTLVLRPNDLGRLSIEMVSNNQGLSANILAQNDDVRKFIEKNIETLKQQLNNAGVSVNNIQIKTAGQQNSSNYSGNEPNQQNFENQKEGSAQNQNQQEDKHSKRQTKETLDKITNLDFKFEKDFGAILNKSINYGLN